MFCFSLGKNCWTESLLCKSALPFAIYKVHLSAEVFFFLFFFLFLLHLLSGRCIIDQYSICVCVSQCAFTFICTYSNQPEDFEYAKWYQMFCGLSVFKLASCMRFVPAITVQPSSKWIWKLQDLTKKKKIMLAEKISQKCLIWD